MFQRCTFFFFKTIKIILRKRSYQGHGNHNVLVQRLLEAVVDYFAFMVLHEDSSFRSALQFEINDSSAKLQGDAKIDDRKIAYDLVRKYGCVIDDHLVKLTDVQRQIDGTVCVVVTLDE